MTHITEPGDEGILTDEKKELPVSTLYGIFIVLVFFIVAVLTLGIAYLAKLK